LVIQNGDRANAVTAGTVERNVGEMLERYDSPMFSLLLLRSIILLLHGPPIVLCY
jgi:hypothetical protein